MRTFIQKPKSIQKSNSINNTKKRDKAFFTQNAAVESILHLQRTVGNQTVLRMLQAQTQERDPGPPRSNTMASPLGYDFTRIPVNHAKETVRTKLSINNPGDKYEQEADHLADQVMCMSRPVGSPYRDSRPDTKDSIHASASHRSADGKILEPENRQFFESRFNHNFADVRVYADSKANASARGLQARAYTVGTNIIFGPGEYQPHTREGRHLLSHELTHVIQQRSISKPSSLIIQRTPVTFRRGTTITADPVQARRTFSRIRESVQAYSDNSLDYFSNQYQSAMTSFRLWYNRQSQADASFFNSVVNIIMNSAWAWGSPVVGAVAAPVGSIIMLIAQGASRSIQNSRNEFADSLIRSANNLQASMQRRLSGRVPEIIERGNPGLWEDIERRAYFGEEWQSLLHQRAGLPQRGINYQARLLSKLIFEYRRWELLQQSASYRGIYSFSDPSLTHMRGRARAEAFIESGLPIPRDIRQYAHPGERVER